MAMHVNEHDGCAWAPSRGVESEPFHACVIADRPTTAGNHEDMNGFDPSSTRRGRRSRVPGDHRRRPAQVFCGFPDRWEVGMSKPSALTIRPPLHRCGAGRIRTSISLAPLSASAPRTSSRERTTDNDPERSTACARRRWCCVGQRRCSEAHRTTARGLDRQGRLSKRRESFTLRASNRFASSPSKTSPSSST